jgi:hypothetical protein
MAAKFLVILCVSLIGGCLSIAAYYDSQDPCQRTDYPDWCGSADSNTVIVNGTTYNIRKVK